MGKIKDEQQLKLSNCDDALELAKFKKRTKVKSTEVFSSKKREAVLFDNRIHKLLSTKEASGLLGVSPNALRILVCRKRIKAYKLGSRLKFKTVDLMDCLQQKEV